MSDAFHVICRWKGVFPDALVLFAMLMFGASVGQRVHHIASRHNRHLWRLLYEKTGLLLDVTILVLQAFSETLPSALCLVVADELIQAALPWSCPLL